MAECHLMPWHIADLTPAELHAAFLYAHPEENR